MTIDTQTAATSQSAGSAGGLHGGGSNTSDTPVAGADQFAALIAQFRSGEGALPPAEEQAPQSDGAANVANPQLPVNVVLGLIGQHRGPSQIRSGAGAGKTAGEGEAGPPVAASPAADATNAVAVPVCLWTLGELPVPVAASQPAGSAQTDEARITHSAPPNGAQETVEPGVAPKAGAPSLLELKATVPGLPEAAGLAGREIDQGGNTAQAPVGLPAAPPNRSAASSKAPPVAADAHSIPIAAAAAPAAADPARVRELLAARGISASSQPAPVVAREAGAAPAPPVPGVREDNNASGAPDTSADHSGYRQTAPPPGVPIDTIAAGLIRNDHGGAPVAEPIAAVAAVAASQPGIGMAVPVQHATDSRAVAVPDDADLRRQIVQAVRMQWTGGVGDARLTLQPEYLGEVTISLRIEQGGVSAHVNADAANVREWISANEPLLRQGLSEHGLTLDRLIVSDKPAETRPQSESRPGDDARRQPQQSPADDRQERRRQRAAGTFEITV